MTIVILAFALAAHLVADVPVCPSGAALEVSTDRESSRMTCVDVATHKPQGRMVIVRGGVTRQDTSFVQGEKHGLERTWDERGRLQTHCTFEHGKAVGFCLQMSGGHLSEYGYRGMGAPNGDLYRRWSFWFDGSPQTVTTFVRPGISQGREWRFFRGGRLEAQLDYLDGHVCGRSFSWHEDGSFATGGCWPCDASGVPLWTVKDHAEALRHECATEERIATIVPPPEDHHVPPPSPATHDVLPPGVDIPEFVPPTPPTSP